MKKLDYLAKFILSGIFCTSVFVVSCSDDDKLEEKNNSAPILENENVSVAENIADDFNILTLSAKDAEGDDLTYTISQNSNDLFELTKNDTDVVLSLITNKKLDFETVTTHTITVQVSDGALTDTANIIITVTDVEDGINATAANIGSRVSRVGNQYNFKYNTSNAVEVEVEGYNENYTYELKLTGDSFEKEYSVNLTKAVSKDKGDIRVDIVKDAKANKIAKFSPIESSKTTLVADVQNLDMESDTYTAVLIEKQSGAEIKLTGSSIGYTIIDGDATSFLSGTQLESNNYAKLTELNLGFSRFRVRPTIVNKIKGVGVELAVYNTDLTLLGKVSWSGASGSSINGVYSYQFNSSDVNKIIKSNGEYLFRLEEKKNPNDPVDKTYKNAIFQKIEVKKPGVLIAAEIK